MDKNQIIAKATVELLYKAESLSNQDTLGVKSKYSWNEVIMKFRALELLQDDTADETAQECAMNWLNDTIDQKIVTQYTPLTQKIYIPITERHYRGTIANAQQMALVDAQAKKEGWWWNIIGSFTYEGIAYYPEHEIYWTSTGFSIFGYGGAIGTVPAVGMDLETGALVADTPKTLVHGLGKEHYTLVAYDGDNITLVDQLHVDPANPTNAVIIQVGVDIPDGLVIKIIGY
jgi:hypothetical protein